MSSNDNPLPLLWTYLWNCKSKSSNYEKQNQDFLEKQLSIIKNRFIHAERWESSWTFFAISKQSFKKIVFRFGSFLHMYIRSAVGPHYRLLKHYEKKVPDDFRKSRYIQWTWINTNQQKLNTSLSEKFVKFVIEFAEKWWKGWNDEKFCEKKLWTNSMALWKSFFF